MILLNDEKFCVSFCKDSDLWEKVKEFFKASYEDVRISFLAEQYGIGNAVLDFSYE